MKFFKTVINHLDQDFVRKIMMSIRLLTTNLSKFKKSRPAWLDCGSSKAKQKKIQSMKLGGKAPEASTKDMKAKKKINWAKQVDDKIVIR